MRMPNLLHDSVPVGKDDTQNVPVRTVGSSKKHAFDAKSHVDLLQSLRLADIDRAGKVAGARFFYLTGRGVMLGLAIQQFALNELAKRGYTAIDPPYLLRRQAIEGATDLHDFEDVIYLLVACLNHGIHPVVPEQGSVGASGDLAPLAHIALVLIGEGEAGAPLGGGPEPGAEALRRAGLSPVVLEAKEGLALINGTQPSTAIVAKPRGPPMNPVCAATKRRAPSARSARMTRADPHPVSPATL
jgi:hypothetical protein